MTVDNLRFVGEQLLAQVGKPDDLTLWLEGGVRSIVLEGVSPQRAFMPGRHIIGAVADNWRADLQAVYQGLPERYRLWMRHSLADLLQRVPPESLANDPGRQGGRNPERLALVALSIARDWKAPEVLGVLDALIHTKFPRSQVVYDSAFSAWRLLAAFDSHTDWREVFLPFDDGRREPRFRPSYALPLALGMAAAQPRRATVFLEDWPVIRDYLHRMVHEPPPETARLLAGIALFMKKLGLSAAGGHAHRPVMLDTLAQIGEHKVPGLKHELALAMQRARKDNLPLPASPADNAAAAAASLALNEEAPLAH